MKKTVLLAAALLAASAGEAAAQRTIAPGMTTDQVRASFGAPAATRASGEWTYWYYHNGCPVRCGSDDVVFFREARVVAAVLRTGQRRFSGPTASDALERFDDAPPPSAGAQQAEAPVNLGRIGRPREEADAARADEGAPAPARVGGVRVEGRSGAEGAQGEGRSTIIRGNAPAARSGSEAARSGAGVNAEAPEGEEELLDERLEGAPATQVNDERREREGRVEPNTVRNRPDTVQAERRERERAVAPRVVPQNP